jgi:hypothetical protein
MDRDTAPAEAYGFTAADLAEWLACSEAARERVWMRSGFYADRVKTAADWVGRDAGRIAAGQWLQGAGTKALPEGEAKAPGRQARDRAAALRDDPAERHSMASDAVLDALRTAKPHDPRFGGEPVFHRFDTPLDLLKYVHACARHRTRELLFRYVNDASDSVEDLVPDPEGSPWDRLRPQDLAPGHLEALVGREAWERAVGLVGGFEAWHARAKPSAASRLAHFRGIRQALEDDPVEILSFLFANRHHLEVLAWFRARDGGITQNTFNSSNRRVRSDFAAYGESLQGEDQALFERLREAAGAPGDQEEGP